MLVMNKIVIFFIIVTLFLCCDLTKKQTPNEFKGFVPKTGFVPDSATAIKIAEAIWFSIYGNEIYQNKPYQIKLIGDTVWSIEGSLPEDLLGGVPYIEIDKRDCRILKVTHGK